MLLSALSFFARCIKNQPRKRAAEARAAAASSRPAPCAPQELARQQEAALARGARDYSALGGGEDRLQTQQQMALFYAQRQAQLRQALVTTTDPAARREIHGHLETFRQSMTEQYQSLQQSFSHLPDATAPHKR